MTGRYRYATDHHGQKLIVAREGLLWFFLQWANHETGPPPAMTALEKTDRFHCAGRATGIAPVPV
jgi:hypothetical protein